MISAEESFKRKAVLFEEGKTAEALCLLKTGSVDLSFTIGQEEAPKSRMDLPVGEINTGEMLGVSGLVEPHVYTATARAAMDGSLLKNDGPALLKLLEEDPRVGHEIMCHVAGALAERLQATRVQLAAARVQQGDEKATCPEMRTACVVVGALPRPPHMRIPLRNQGLLIRLRGASPAAAHTLRRLRCPEKALRCLRLRSLQAVRLQEGGPAQDLIGRPVSHHPARVEHDCPSE